LLLLLLGVCGVVLTGDLFNLFIWYEVQVLTAVGLLTLGGGRRQMAGGLFYSMINLLGSLGFLAACGLLYGLVGSLNMALVSDRLETVYTTSPELVAAVASLLLLSLGTRAAIVPLSFWGTRTLHMPPVAVGMLLGGILTSTGFYGLYRVVGLIYREPLPVPSGALLLLAALTMLVGVLGALGQSHIRQIIAFLLLAQAGYVLLGLGLASESGVAASVLFLLHDTLLLSALMGLCGTVELLSKTGDIRQMGGVVAREPGLALVWFVAFVSLVGVLPLGGFFARLALLQAALSVERYLVALLVVGITLLSLLPLLKIWHEVFWKELPTDAPVPRRAAFPHLVPGLFLVAIVLLSSLGMTYVVEYSTRAAQQILDAPAYVADVLGSAAGE
jgi:multicomponent Na+:H+ antiporter subunit D